MNYYLSRNNPHYSFALENTINYSNARAQPNPNANGQNGQKSILEEIKDILYDLNKSINSLNYKMSYLSYTVKNAKVEILRALEKKKEPSSPGNSTHSDQLIQPRSLKEQTGFCRRRDEGKKNK